MRECPLTIPITIAHNSTNPSNPGYLHFVVLRRGQLELRVNGKLVGLKAGSVLATRFGPDLVASRSDPDWLMLSFSPGLLHDDLGTYPTNPKLDGSAEMDFWLIEPYFETDFVVLTPQSFYFESLVFAVRDCDDSIQKQESPFWRCFARSAIFDFLQTLRRTRESTLRDDAKLVSEVMIYLANQLPNRPTLESTARQIGINRTLFSKKLQTHSGKTFHEILSDLRLQKAEWLVRNTNLPLNQVTERIGLNDQTHFTRLFKSSFLATPSEYRRRHKIQKAENS